MSRPFPSCGNSDQETSCGELSSVWCVTNIMRHHHYPILFLHTQKLDAVPTIINLKYVYLGPRGALRQSYVSLTLGQQHSRFPRMTLHAQTFQPSGPPVLKKGNSFLLKKLERYNKNCSACDHRRCNVRGRGYILFTTKLTGCNYRSR